MAGELTNVVMGDEGTPACPRSGLVLPTQISHVRGGAPPPRRILPPYWWATRPSDGWMASARGGERVHRGAILTLQNFGDVPLPEWHGPNR
jgi:hypothetical protein